MIRKESVWVICILTTIQDHLSILSNDTQMIHASLFSSFISALQNVIVNENILFALVTILCSQFVIAEEIKIKKIGGEQKVKFMLTTGISVLGVGILVWYSAISSTKLFIDFNSFNPFAYIFSGILIGYLIVVLLRFINTQSRSTASSDLNTKSLLSEMSEIARFGTWEIDLKTEKIKWSDIIYDIYELKKGEKMSLDETLNSYHPDHQPIINQVVKEGMVSGKPWDLELKLITANSNEKWVRVIGKSILEDGKPVKLQGLLQDINEKKSMEEKLVKANKELESLSYAVSHDLRAPIRAINGFAEALNLDKQHMLDHDSVRYLNRILNNGKKMEGLITDLLDFGRQKKKSVNIQPIDTNLILTQLIEESFEEQVSIIKLEKLPKINADKGLVTRVFENVISNAIKYSSKEEKPVIRITAEEDLNHVIIKIQDNGVGFDLESDEKLFQVFQRLHSDEEFEGTGVGLALCFDIMQAHGGGISAEGIKNEGASFSLKFKKVHRTSAIQ